MSIGKVIRYFFLKVLPWVLFSVLMSFFILFPFNDLSDLISTQISKVSNNEIFLKFKEFKVSPLPPPSVGLEEVQLSTKLFNNLTLTSIEVSPAISGLIRQKPFGTIKASGIFNGEIEARISNGSKTENGLERFQLNVDGQDLNLKNFQKSLGLSIPLKGSLSVDTQALADLTFAEQPDVSLSLKIKNFELPSTQVPTSFGPMTIPLIKLKEVELTGRLSNGIFVIEKGSLGVDKDELNGKISGDLAVQIQQNNGQLIPIIGAYNLNIQINTKKAFLDRAGIYLALLNQYQSPTNDGAQYKFKVSAQNIQMPPSISGAQ